MKQVEVWVPHRISGFFQMMDPTLSREPLDPINIGSRGGGPALNAYGKTHISLLSSDSDSSSNPYKIFINDIEKTNAAHTSRTVIDLMKPSKYLLCSLTSLSKSTTLVNCSVILPLNLNGINLSVIASISLNIKSKNFPLEL